MDETNVEERVLPLFRRDLELYRGPDESDGSPTYNLFDPLKPQYYKISWQEALIFQLQKKGMNAQQLVEAIKKHSTLEISSDEIYTFFQLAARLNLLALPRPSEHVIQEEERGKSGWLNWLLINYLYFRIPLINPDAFLKRTLHWVVPFGSRTALIIYFFTILIGLILLIQRFDEFLHTFPYFFNVEGLFFYGVGITCVKVIHEFSHAYTAAYYGVHVPTMGIAVIVLWPVLYTDVTDSWKLAKRSQRLAISFAGVGAELVLAGLCTCGWLLTPPGVLHSVFFVISSATWIKTLAINLNPAMRFDGYYLLCDLWGIDNLRPRAFAVARWKLRHWLLGLDLPPPEEDLPTGRQWGMVIYSVYSWVYLLTLYTLIAAFVYYEFTKVLGIILFIVEVIVFIMWPFASEARQLYELRSSFTRNGRLITTSILCGLALAWWILPYPHLREFSGITIPAQEEEVYIPYPSYVQAIYVKRGDLVQADMPLVDLASSELTSEIKSNHLDEQILEREIYILGLQDSQRPFIGEKEEELAKIRAKGLALQSQLEQLRLTSKIDGTLLQWDENLKVGEFVAANKVLGKIGDQKSIHVICFVPENELKEIHPGQSAVFRFKYPLYQIRGQVKNVVSVRTLMLRYPQLASIYQGALPVTQEEKVESKGISSGQEPLELLETYYPVEVVLDTEEEPLPRIGQVGDVQIRGPWRSYLMELIEYFQRVYVRESGF